MNPKRSPRSIVLGLALCAVTIWLCACSPALAPTAPTSLAPSIAAPALTANLPAPTAPAPKAPPNASPSAEAATVPPEESPTTPAEELATVPLEDTPADEESTPTLSPLPPEARIIHLLGRSVTYLWFQHWGWQGDDEMPVVHGRYLLFHHSIDDPANMLNSIRDIVSALPDDPNVVVQWKFCFDDFGGAEDAQPTIQRNETIVQQVYQLVVEQRHHKLIIGNALPKTEMNADPDLVTAQRQYNHWLVDFQNMHSGQVFVFDQYSVLADANGLLHAEFASAPDDNHPNDTGYRALDGKYFSFLDGVLK